MKNSDLEKIQELVKENSKTLDRITNITLPSQSYSTSAPEMIVARKWNSWYPSYFDVKGGGYLFVFGSEIIAIDPGFKFTGIIRELGINPLKIRAIFLTHLHPDHFAGLIEFVTLRHELDLVDETGQEKTKLDIYLNEASFIFFKHILGGSTSLKHVIPGSRIKIFSGKNKNVLLCDIEIIRAYHREQGGHFTSIGLILSIPTPIKNYSVGLMSDTDGSNGYIEEYYQNYNKVDVLIPHVGTVEHGKKPSGGKHLYLDGLNKIVAKLENPKLFLLGEFGLEMGSLPTIVKSVNPLITAEAERIFGESIKELFTKSSTLYSTLLIITTKYLLKKKTYIEFLVILNDEISKHTKEEVWKQAKSSWVKSSKTNRLLIEFPTHIKEALSLNDWTTVRRTWNNLRLYEENIFGYIEEIMRLTTSLVNTGFANRFNEITKSVDLDIFFNNIRTISDRIIRTIKASTISNSLNKAVKTKSYEAVHAIIDQITLTWIILRLSLDYQVGMGRLQGSPVRDFRNAVSDYFDEKIIKNDQRMVPGEFGTKIRFDTSIRILTSCPSCKRKRKYVSIENYDNSKYDTEKERILHLYKGECKECQYSRYVERGYYESKQYAQESKRWEEEQMMLWEAGAFAYFFTEGPPSLRQWLSKPPLDLIEVLDSHLYMLDDIFENLLHSERMTIWTLDCKSCNESMLKLNCSKESVHFNCLTTSCEQELVLPIDDKLSIENTRDRYTCPKCETDAFEFAIGFEYVRDGEEDLTEDDYSKIHVASFCIKCGNKNNVCCTKEIKRIRKS